MVLVHDTSSHRGLQVYQVSLKNLKRFSSYRADRICDGQTDGQGKTICLPTLSGGDITIMLQSLTTMDGSLSPDLTVLVLPRFAMVKTSRYTVINWGTVPTKSNHVLTVMVLPRYSPALVHRSTTVSPRCGSVFPGFTTVKSGGIRVYPGVENNNPSELDATGANQGSPWFAHLASRFAPVESRFVSE